MPTANDRFHARPPTPANRTQKPEAAKLGFHEGNVLGYLARTYPYLDEAVFEAVQNSIDAGASKITVTINKMASARNITICDNGNGADNHYFNQCLASIGESKKTAGKIGQFGLGIVASYGKCDYFTFTSIPANNRNGMLEWTFDCESMKKKGKGLEAPVREIKLPKPEWWRSKLHIAKFETDRIRAHLDLESICEGILSRYNEHLRPYKTKVTVKVTEANGEEHEKTIEAMDYTGSPLPVKVYEGELSGRTEVRLYLAKPKQPKGGHRQPVYRGLVRVKSGNNSGIILNEKNAMKAVCGHLSKDTMSKLTSGIFEGIINFDGEKVKMDPSRMYMVDSVELLEACEKIERWMEDVGHGHISKIEDQSKGERYERLGKRSLKLLKYLYRKDSEIGKLIRSFQVGSEGKGHIDHDRETGELINATSTDGSRALPDGNKPKDEKKHERDRKEPEKERPDHTPTTVLSKKGNPRKLVKDSSLGITVAYGPVEGTWMWEMDQKRGILTINIFHPLWSGVESAHSNETAREKCLMDLQERLIIFALRMHEAKLKFLSNNEDTGEFMYMVAEETIKNLIQDEIPLITHADKLTKRGQFYNRLAKKSADEDSSDGKEE